MRKRIAEEGIDRVGVAIDLCHKTTRLTAREEAQGESLDSAEDRLFQIKAYLRRDHGGHIVIDDAGKHLYHLHGDEKDEDREYCAIELTALSQNLGDEVTGGKVCRPNGETCHGDK